MLVQHISSVRMLWIAILMAVPLTGCQSRIANYTPSRPAAEGALKKALDAWKAAQPVGDIPTSQPVIQVVDVGRKPGQTLASYRILGESKGASSGRSFVVTLELQNPSETVKTRYIVVGIDPLWVFRQEDYELLSHWDHHMPADAAPAGGTRPPAAGTP